MVYGAPLIQYSVFSNCSSTVTVSPSGPRKLFKGVTTAMSGVLARFPVLLPVRNSFASYGASAASGGRVFPVCFGREHIFGDFGTHMKMEWFAMC